MGGAVMLLIAATVGITYGWTPDGGQGVKYIIQIPPGDIDQVVRSGEIASNIPVEIRGHVSEVVIQVGNGSLPRITPSNLARTIYQTPNQVAAEDRTPLPIPAMRGSIQLSPIRSMDSATAMMKPAPQAGGMNLPGSLGPPSTNPMGPSTTAVGPTNPSTQFNLNTQVNPNPQTNPSVRGFGLNLQQNARDSLNSAGNQLRNTANDVYQRSQQEIGQAADQLGRSANSRIQSAADSTREAMGTAFGNDDPRSRLGASSSTNSTANNGSRSAPQNTATNSTNAKSEQDWYDLRNGPRRRPSTDPIATNVPSSDQTNSRSPSLFGNSNFGRLPGGVQSNSSLASDSTRTSGPSNQMSAGNISANQMTNGSMTNSQSSNRSSNVGDRYGLGGNNYADASRNSSNASLDYDSRLTTAQAQQLPPNGYSFDSQGYPIDREGYRLNRFGQRTDPTSVASGNGFNSTDPRNPNQMNQGNVSGTNLQAINRNNYSNDPRFTGVNGTANANGTPYGNSNTATLNNANSNVGNPNAYPYGNNPQLVQPPLAAGPGQYPVTGNLPPTSYQPGAYAGVNVTNPANPYINAATINPASTGTGVYPPFTDPRLAALAGGSPPATNANAPKGAEDNTTLTSASDRGSELEDLDAAAAGRYRDSLQNPDQVAAQPIFNAMLLFSIVANCYLLYWLKNLRLQFRDSVAAKRSSNPANGIAATV